MTPSRRKIRERTGRLLVVICTLVTVLPAFTLAQRTNANVRGLVTDSVGRPLPLAQVILGPNGGEATTDSAGRFLITNLRLGSYHLIVRRLGYAPLFADAEIRRPDESELRILLYSTGGGTVHLDTVVVTATSIRSPELVGFYERRATGIGQFISPGQIEARKGSTLSEVLRSYASRLRYVRRACSNGFAVIGGDAPRDLNPGPKLNDGPGCLMDPACYVQVFVEGMRVYSYDRSTLPPNIDEYQIGQIEAIEVYHGGAETPSRFSGTGAACGTILIWLKR